MSMELRSSKKQPFSGFNKIQIMEQSLVKSGDECLNEIFCKKLSRQFNHANGLTGKPAVKWTEIQSWFQRNQENFSKETTSDATDAPIPEPHHENILEIIKMMQRAKGDNPSNVKLEAKSSTDGAWYDVDAVLKHKGLNNSDTECHVSFEGFAKKYNEWVKLNAIRRRSIPLEDSDEHSDCKKLMAGDSVLCFQETQEHAKFYDARVIKVQRWAHDVRGCRCKVVIRYDHRDNEEEEMPLTSICCQPDVLARLRDREDCK